MIVSDISRRQFVKSFALATSGAILTPKIVAARSVPSSAFAERSLHLHNTHTGEFFKEAFWAEGSFVESALKDLNRLLRDWRTNDETTMCPDLMTLLWEVVKVMEVDPKKPLEIICGYRSPKTNEMLRRKKRGVAKHSKHLTGNAVDFYIPGVRLKTIRNTAVSFQKGGVGYYPRSGFVHVDTRPRPAVW
ncbi:MAG: DUF882 domain-containing protein [Alphaproteobacteria bacterium]